MGRITNQTVLARLKEAEEHQAAATAILQGLASDAANGQLEPEYVEPLKRLAAGAGITVQASGGITADDVKKLVAAAIKELPVVEFGYPDGTKVAVLKRG